MNIKLDKKILQSNSKNYVSKFLEQEKNNSDIIEIHNNQIILGILKISKIKK